MSEIKKQFSELNHKEKSSLKQVDLDTTEEEGCRKSLDRKFEYCIDVLANYFECLRVFSDQKLEQIRRKAIEQQLQQEQNNKSAKSETSIEIEKYSEIQNKSNLKQMSRKDKSLLVEDFNELPVNNYSTNQRLRFTKRYAQIYQKSYSERRNKFGYSFEQVEIQRERQYLKKQKNFWEEFKRFICCRGGNYINEMQEKYTDYETTLNENHPEQHYSQKELKKQPSLASQKNRQQNNVFLFEQQNDVKQAPEQILLTKHGKKINKNIKVIGTEGQTEHNSSRKSQNLQKRESRQGQARKVSSRLGVDTQLLVKRKQYEQKNNDEYIYKQKNDRTQTTANPYANHINNENNQYRNQNTYNKYNNDSNHQNWHNTNQGNTNQGHEDYNGYQNNFYNDTRYEGGVLKKRGDKKDKISNMIKQIQNQNQEQFIDNQVSLDKVHETGFSHNPGHDHNRNNYNQNQYNHLDQSFNNSNSSNLNDSMYHRANKSKKAQKNMNISGLVDKQQEEVPSFDMNANQQFNSPNNEMSFNLPEQGESTNYNYNNHNNNQSSRNKQAQSHLVIKSRQDNINGYTMDDVPNLDLSMNINQNELSSINKTEAPAFKKKKKNKLINKLEITEDKDQVIMLTDNNDELANHNTQDYYDSKQEKAGGNNISNSTYNEAYNAQQHVHEANNNFQNQGQSEIKTHQQMNKKKKNKRKNLIVEQDDNQEVLDLENL